MPVYLRFRGWYVFFWSNEQSEPIHFHIAEGKPGQNSTKVWILKNRSMRLQNNNSKVPSKVLSEIIMLMQLSIEEYEELWKSYQGEIHYIDE